MKPFCALVFSVSLELIKSHEMINTDTYCSDAVILSLWVVLTLQLFVTPLQNLISMKTLYFVNFKRGLKILLKMQNISPKHSLLACTESFNPVTREWIGLRSRTDNASILMNPSLL